MRRDRYQPEEAEPIQLPANCQLRSCPCGNQGGPDIVIRHNGVVEGYVCQTGYFRHIVLRGRDQMSQFKEKGEPVAKPEKLVQNQTQARHVAEIASELDALAERYAAEQEDA